MYMWCSIAHGAFSGVRGDPFYDKALVIPRGDLLYWKFIDLLKFQISNKFQ